VRGRRLRLAVATAWLALGGALRAQTAAPAAVDYAAAIETYAEGHDAAKAAASLGRVGPDALLAAARKYLAGPQPSFTAAAVFHLEIAIGVVTLSARLAEAHLEVGQQIIRELRPVGRGSASLSTADAAAFTERWYAAAASTFLMVNDADRAQPYIDRGLQHAPASPELRLMSGIVDELVASAVSPDEAYSSDQRGRILTLRTQGLLRARKKFQELLADEPRFTRARIRLGRVLSILGDSDDALVLLRQAQSEVREPKERYLVAMFLGALYEQQRDVAGARVAYETALAAAPASQAAAVALGHLEVMAGRPDRAQALARALLAKPPVADEWWSYKNGGFETAALAWLRYRVWR
jgi:tetratricopeptide (TPR) repeat protein